MRTSFEIVAVELFVGRWILFGLRQRMAISSAIAAARMSAVQVCARAASTVTHPELTQPFKMTISDTLHTYHSCFVEGLVTAYLAINASHYLLIVN